MNDDLVLTCGWCRVMIPSLDEVQHHFLVAHGQSVDQSVRYHYPERFADEVERWSRRATNLLR